MRGKPCGRTTNGTSFGRDTQGSRATGSSPCASSLRRERRACSCRPDRVLVETDPVTSVLDALHSRGPSTTPGVARRPPKSPATLTPTSELNPSPERCSREQRSPAFPFRTPLQTATAVCRDIGTSALGTVHENVRGAPVRSVGRIRGVSGSSSAPGTGRCRGPLRGIRRRPRRRRYEESGLVAIQAAQ